MTSNEPAHPAAPAPSSAPHPTRWRLATLAGAAMVLVGGAAIAMAASPQPSTSPDSGTVQPDSGLVEPFRDGRGPGGLFDGFAGFAGRHGGFGAGAIEITAISGSSLTLETVDGWTRTITITDATELSKDGEEIALSDLEVGDRVRFRQTVADDGSYTVTALGVVLPSVIGQVTAVDGDSMTLTQPDGTSVTVNVDDATEFTVGGETGQSLSDVEVGMVVAASGEQNDDGSLDASRVRAGTIWQGMGRGAHGPGRGPWANPDGTPSATPEDSSTSSS